MKVKEKYRVKITIERVEDESPKGKYILDNTNRTVADNETGLIGVPCKVISDVYRTGGESRIRVQSLITGIVYQTAYDPKYQRFFDDFHDILVASEWWLEHGFCLADSGCEKQLIGKPYFMYNSVHSRTFGDFKFETNNSKLEIISLPFEDYTYIKKGGKRLFVLVSDENGKVGRVPFEEWHLQRKCFDTISTDW